MSWLCYSSTLEISTVRDYLENNFKRATSKKIAHRRYGSQVRLLIKYYDQGVVVFVWTDRQRKEQKPDTEKIRKLNTRAVQI